MLEEFKDFVNRGNLVELAIAFVLASAFGLVVRNIVNGIFMPTIAAIFGQPNFDDVGLTLGETPVQVGLAITAIVDFVIVGFVCFLVVKAYIKTKKPADAATDSGPTEIELLTEIRDALRNR